MNQAGNLHLIARAELFLEKTKTLDSELLRKMWVWQEIHDLPFNDMLSGLSLAWFYS